MLRWSASSSYSSDCGSRSSSPVSSVSGISSAFGFGLSQGIGCGARTIFASQSLANCLKSEVAVLITSASVLLVDPLSL